MRTLLTSLALVPFIWGTLLSSAADDGKIQVVASTTLIADVARQVAGDSADVISLLPPDADPHSYQLVPQDVATLAEADVIFINGGGLEQSVTETIENSGSEGRIVAVSTCVPILMFGDHHDDHEHEDDHDDHEGDHDHDDEHNRHHSDLLPSLSSLCDSHEDHLDDLDFPDDDDHEELYELDCGGDAHSHDGHDHGACDPHVWTDPVNVGYWTLIIRDTLSALDPQNADTYTANASSYLTALHELATITLPELVNQVPAGRRVLVSNHETLGYFAHAYGFEVVGTVLPGGITGAQPSAQEMVALIEVIQTNNAGAIFAENTVSADIAEQIAEETGVPVIRLYSDALSATDGPAATYLDYMHYNVQQITDALKG